jgi:hypothetical protein
VEKEGSRVQREVDRIGEKKIEKGTGGWKLGTEGMIKEEMGRDIGRAT